VLVFSILGYMAHVQETTIEDVVNSGPGNDLEAIL
jgi:hypothetical protein